MIVGMVGFKGCGKDAAGQRLVDQHGFALESFANPLKDALASMLVWDRNALEGLTQESRTWRETPDEYWSEVLGRPVSPRWAMQYFGTEVIRNHFHHEMWVESMRKRLLEAQERGKSVVITDCRFPNELALVRLLGGKIVRVSRGEEPSWFNTAISANDGNPISKLMMRYWFKVHASERAWIGQTFDHVINNDSDLPGLEAKMDGIVSSWRA